MSYDISLVSRKDGKEMTLKDPFYVHGGTVRAEMVNGRLVQARETEASINITYNYSSYYKQATKNEEIFTKKDEDGNRVTGIRAIYGMTPAESIPLLLYMIAAIETANKDENGEWMVTERTQTRYFDEDGEEVTDASRLFSGKEFRKVEETYTISEGDTSNYWCATAANAIRPLRDMIHMATDCLMDDCFWDGD